MVFQKYCSEKSEMHYWYIIHDIKEISEKILKFQQCVPSQSPTNHPICCHLVYHCLCTEKKISQFKWNFDKTLPIISIRLNATEPYLFSRNNFHFFRHILSCTTKTSKHLVKKNIGQSNWHIFIWGYLEDLFILSKIFCWSKLGQNELPNILFKQMFTYFSCQYLKRELAVGKRMLTQSKNFFVCIVRLILILPPVAWQSFF